MVPERYIGDDEISVLPHVTGELFIITFIREKELNRGLQRDGRSTYRSSSPDTSTSQPSDKSVAIGERLMKT